MSKKKKKNKIKAENSNNEAVSNELQVSPLTEDETECDIFLENSGEKMISEAALCAPAPEQDDIATEESEQDEGSKEIMPAAPMVDIPYNPDFSGEDFSMSVKDLKAEDIKMSEGGEKTKKKKKKMSKLENIIQLTILGICACAAVVCLVMLGQNIWGKIRGQQIYSNTEFFNFTLDDAGGDTMNLAAIRADIPLMTLFDRIDAGESAVIEESGGKYDAQLAQMRASLSALKAKNDDVYGWIYIEGTNINHPVVRGNDNDYYLDHAYTGKEYLTIGSIFADCTTKDLISDNYNTVLYGHNVVSSGQSSMFHDIQVKIVNDEEFFRTCKIYIYTMDGVFVYKPVSIYATVAEYLYFRTSFASENDFLKFADEVVGKSQFYTGEKFFSGDTMLTLSTCTNGATNGRYALHAKLVEVVK
ncbi:MAG: class B sortase [Ruminococcaceae bacterium]|nr:class B sortase [Oscillospiraceae bacterium]